MTGIKQLTARDGILLLLWAGITTLTWYFMHGADHFLALTPEGECVDALQFHRVQDGAAAPVQSPPGMGHIQHITYVCRNQHLL
jgi:hypothetical protein